MIRKRNTAKRCTNKISAFDVETWGLDARKFAFGVCVWREKNGDIQRKVFYDREQMMNFMVSRRFRGYIWWGHNAGAYDMISLFGNYLQNRNFKVVMNKGRFIKAEYKTETGHKIYFQDTLNFFGTSLEKLAKDVANEKLITPDKFKVSVEDEDIIRYMVEAGKWTIEDVMRIYGIQRGSVEAILSGKFERYLEAYDVEYCIRDAEIVLIAVEKLAEWVYENFRVNLTSTIASLSLRIFFTHFLKEDIKVSELDSLFRNSYYGGRVEVFRDRFQWRNVKYYDFNSLYPSVMYQKEYPDPSSLEYEPFPSKNFIYEFEGVSEITVYVPEDMGIPPLPIRYSGKLIFPVGYMKGWWNHNELRMAEKYGVKILKVYRTVYTTRTIRPFREFVEYFYTLRKKYKEEGNKTYDLFTKIIMNSLYGKFGQQNEYREIGFIDEERGEDWIFEPFGESDLGEWKKVDENGNVIKTDAKHSVLCWASYVTSWARIYLYEKIMEVQRKGGKVYYCDTDSVLCDVDLATGNELGQLKLEDEGRVYLIVPKSYIFDSPDGTKVKMKGIRNPDIKLKEKYYERRVVKVKEALRRKKEAGEGELRIKEPRFEDDKRMWINDRESRPWVYHKLVANDELQELVKRDVDIIWREQFNGKNIINIDGEYKRYRSKPDWYYSLKRPSKRELMKKIKDEYGIMFDVINESVIIRLGGGDVDDKEGKAGKTN